MNLQSTFEAIDQKVGSPFFKDLTKAFSETQELVDLRINENEDTVLKSGKGYDAFAREVKAFIEPRLKMICKKYTGLNIDTFFHIDLGVHTFYPLCTNLQFGLSYFELAKKLESVAGKASFKESASLREYFKEIDKAFDPKEGYIRLDKLPKEFRENIRPIVYCDLNTFFLFKHLFGTKRFTCLEPSEMAALFLHEVGHSVTLIEYFGANYFYEYPLNVRLKKLKKDMDTEKLAKEVKDLAEYTKEHMETFGVGEDASLMGMQKFIQEVLEFFEELDSPFWKFVKKTSHTFISMALLNSALFFALTNIIGGLLYAFPANALLYGAISNSFTNYRDKKRSDQFVSSKNNDLIERRCDEYSTLNGCGGDLSSGLATYSEIASLIGNGSLFYNHGFRKNFLTQSLMKVFSFSMELNSQALIGAINEMHGTDKDRIKHSMRVQARMLSKMGLPKAHRDEVISQFEKSMKAVDRIKAKSSLNEGIKLFQYLGKIIATGVFYIPHEKRIDKDMTVYLEKIEDMTGTKLHYQAAKLDQLAGRM